MTYRLSVSGLLAGHLVSSCVVSAPRPLRPLVSVHRGLQSSLQWDRGLQSSLQWERERERGRERGRERELVRRCPGHASRVLLLGELVPFLLNFLK